MAARLSRDQALRLRMRSQRLHPRFAPPELDVAALVGALCGVQAQDASAAALALRVRSCGLTAGDVARAREAERSIVLTWSLRGTMHLVAAKDLGWLLAYLGPTFIRQSGRRYAQLGLDAAVRAHALRSIRNALAAHGPMTRPELADALAAEAIPVAGQAIAHLVRYAALEGAICFGPRRGAAPTYVLLDDWARPSGRLDPDHAKAELAGRYLEAFGPAAPGDLASWAGIPVAEARAGFSAISDRLEAVEIDGIAAWALARPETPAQDAAPSSPDAPAGAPVVRLLPYYDLYLLGYRSRALAVAAPYERRIHPGGGQIKPTLLVDGRARGVWRLVRRRGGIMIVVEPFESIGPDAMSGLEAEVHDIGRFLGLEAGLEVRGAS